MHIKKPLMYLCWLTDDFGIWQHSRGDTIDYDKGYALDDVARGLIAYLLYGDERRAEICLRYLEQSQTSKGFVGFFDKQRKPLDARSSSDAHALAVWALATAVSHGFEVERAQEVLRRGAPRWPQKVSYLRTLAYMLLAFCELKDEAGANRLATTLLRHFDPKLGWFEHRLTYANAVIPLSLMRYAATFEVHDKKLNTIVLTAMATLKTYSRLGIIPAPVGNRIWQRVGKVGRDVYGQQPIDAGFMVLMYAEAARLYGDAVFIQEVLDWFAWFTGNNIYQASLINDRQGCADGLDEPGRWGIHGGINPNRGAESTIMYLLALHARNELVSPSQEYKG